MVEIGRSSMNRMTDMRRVIALAAAVAGLAGGLGVSEAEAAAPGKGGNRPQVSRQLDADAKPGTRDTYTYKVAARGCRAERNDGRSWFWWLGRVPLR